MEKYFRGHIVRIQSLLGYGMTHFPKNELAVILNSNSGHRQRDSQIQYEILLLSRCTSIAWYYENQLTLIDNDRNKGERIIQKYNNNKWDKYQMKYKYKLIKHPISGEMSLAALNDNYDKDKRWVKFANGDNFKDLSLDGSIDLDMEKLSNDFSELESYFFIKGLRKAEKETNEQISQSMSELNRSIFGNVKNNN